MHARAELRIGDRTVYSFPHQQITLQLPTDIFERWVASGPDWLARMEKLLRDSATPK